MLALILAVAMASGAVERPLPVGAFHAVDLATKATVRIEQAPVSSVSASGDSRLVRCVTADVRDGRLIIGWAGHRGATDQIHAAPGDIIVRARADCPREADPQRLSIKVSGPMIDGVALRNVGAIEVASMRVRAFNASIYERGTITINGLHADTATLSVPGIGQIVASGELEHIGISIGGEGGIDTRSAHAHAIDAFIAGRGTILANVDGPATGSLNGTGTIAIGGHPACQIRNSGRGRIICPAIS